MHARRIEVIMAWMPALGILLLGGCPPLGFLEAEEAFRNLPPEAFEQRVVLGGTAERTIIARTAFDDPFAGLPPDFNPFDPASLEDVFVTEFEDFEPEPPRTDIIAVNLTTLESEVLLTGISADAFSLTTDGRRIAWFDFFDDVVKVVDLDSGAESRFFPGLLGGRIDGVTAIDGPYLVLPAGPPGFSGSALLVVNLDTDEQSVIAPAFLVNPFGEFGGQGSIAIDGDTLAIHIWPPLTADSDLSDESLLNTRIDIVDLVTGQRSTLVADTGPGGNDLLRVEAERVLLLSSPFGFESGAMTTTTVRGYSLDGQTTETLLEFDLADSLTASSFVVGFNENGVLVQTSEFPLPPAFELRERLEFRTFEGATIVITESVASGLTPLTPGFGIGPPLEPTLIDNFVVYQDPVTFGFVVFDLSTQSERRFDPFAE